MRKFILISLLATALTAHAEPSFIQRMDGAIARCTLKGYLATIEASETGQKQGSGSSAHMQALSESHKKAEACVTESKLKIREAYKAELQKKPALRDQLIETYAAWLGYMEKLSQPGKVGDPEPSEADTYEKTKNRLKAELEAL